MDQFFEIEAAGLTTREDRLLNVRSQEGEPQQPTFVRRRGRSLDYRLTAIIRAQHGVRLEIGRAHV